MLLSEMESWVEIAQGVATILAILGGAVWTYFNFFHGRTYKPRLELAIDGRIARTDRHLCGRFVVTAKNVGLSRVSFRKHGSGFKVESCRLIEDGPTPILDWGDGHIYEIFEMHDWIEPGETIVEEQLLMIPAGDAVAVRATVRLNSQRGTTWQQHTICPFGLPP